MGTSRSSKINAFLIIEAVILISLLSFSSIMAEQINHIMFKYWSDYSQDEIAELQNRWTSARVDSIVISARTGKFHPNLDKVLTNLGFLYDLRAIHLIGIDLGSSSFDSCILQGADLSNSNLTLASMRNTHLESAIMENIKAPYICLENAFLRKANLRYSELKYANCKKTIFWLANLEGADFFWAKFDTTFLWNTNFGTAKNVRYVIWGDSLNKRYLIGEDWQADTTHDISYGKAVYKDAELTYKDLKNIYQKEGMNDLYMEFKLRENILITKNLNIYLRIPRILFLEWTNGYGARPYYLISYSIIVILLFWFIYYILSLSRKADSKYGIKYKDRYMWRATDNLMWHCFKYSILAFFQFVYRIKVGDWLVQLIPSLFYYKPIGRIIVLVVIEGFVGFGVALLGLNEIFKVFY